VTTTGLTEEHTSLHETVRRWAADRVPAEAVRAHLDNGGALPPYWSELADLGWLGMGISEQHGGQGFGLPEVAIVVEEMGRAIVPGPFVSTVLAGLLVQEGGNDDLAERLLPGLAGGSLTGSVAFDGVVLGSGDGPVVWRSAGGWAVGTGASAAPSVDRARPAGRIAPADPGADLLPGLSDARASVLISTVLAAEAVGGASWCVATAAEYACTRHQFGRPIGQFQAVKHRCADMLVALELARGVAWDAAQASAGEGDELAAAVAAVVAPEAFYESAKDCIQVLGGMGFTWEHDAHLYLRRAMAMRQLLGPPARRRAAAARLALAGARRPLSVDLPEEAERHRQAVRSFVDELRQRPKEQWRAELAASGFLAPHWPRPWGRDAGPVEQLVIDEELRAGHVRRPHLQVGAWVLPTLIAHGTPEQQERFIPATLRGDITWCQLFSEPGAGSDLASLATRAERAEGGWLVTGQKVWTSMAHEAGWGICLARSAREPDRHNGITCLLVDMRSEGIDIRPLRELTGQSLFNEVFLTEVFVPDDCVVGTPGDGWRVSRTTLANERVSMGSGAGIGPGVESVLQLVRDRGLESDEAVLDQVGGLLVDEQALAVLGLRSTLRALAGADPGPESSVRKLVGAEHEQRVQEVGLELLGPEGALDDGPAAAWIAGLLWSRCLTIAGGTSEIQRNVIAERLLGLPKDP
jgi:3-oxochol-4-en-24-oyl-CoA dehydrogenase